MKLKEISQIIISTGLLGLLGCEAGLDTLPPGEVSESIFWQQDRDARLAVNAAYAVPPW